MFILYLISCCDLHLCSIIENIYYKILHSSFNVTRSILDMYKQTSLVASINNQINLRSSQSYSAKNESTISPYMGPFSSKP